MHEREQANPIYRQAKGWHLELQHALALLSACQLECDGLSNVIGAALQDAGIPFQLKHGRVCISDTGRVIAPHRWICLEDDWIIDLALRMWLSDDARYPHGVFQLASASPIVYQGDAIVLPAIPRGALWVMTDGVSDSLTLPDWSASTPAD